MELVALVAILLLLIFLYFAIGIVLKFILVWFPVIALLPICVFLGFWCGWVGAILAIAVFSVSISLCMKWQNSDLCEKYSYRIDKAFNFSDK